MMTESGAVSGPFTAVQLHELKRQIELFQELNKNLRAILETGQSSAKNNRSKKISNPKTGTKSVSIANTAARKNATPEGSMGVPGNGGTKRKSSTTEAAKESLKGNAKKKRTSSKSTRAMKREEELFEDLEEEDHDEPSLNTTDLEDILTETPSESSSPTLSPSNLTEDDASDSEVGRDGEASPMLELRTFRSVVPKWPNPDDAPCSVCGDESSTDMNEMLICEGPGCSTVVHQDCYGVSRIPDGEWLCDACEAGLSPKESHCLLCPIAGGALRRIVPKSKKVVLPKRKDLCVHIACALWTSDVSISRPRKMQGISLDSLQSNRSEMECQACQQRGGAILRCSAEDCDKACHVMCAMSQQDQFSLGLRPSDATPLLFCRTHSTKKFSTMRKDMFGE
eukprot:jgi/Picsp_1/4630/NSC_02000-R1_protein jade-1